MQRINQELEKLATHRYFPLLGGMIAFLIYLILAWFVLEPRSIWSPDEGAKLLQLKSLRLDNGALNFDIIYTSQGLDTSFKYALINPIKDVLTIQDDALMLPRLPVFTLLSLPFYTLLGLPGLYCIPALGGGITVCLTLVLALRHNRRISLWILIAAGSPVAIYAVIFWEHNLAAALGLAAAWLVWFESEDTLPIWRGFKWIFSAGLLALGTYLRLEVALFSLALIGATFITQHRTRKQLLWITAIYALFMLPYPFLHQVFFEEQSLPMNAQHLNLPMAYLGQTGWQAAVDFLIGPHTDEAINPGWVGALWSILAVTAIGLSFPSLAFPRLRKWTNIALICSLFPAAFFLFTPTAYRAAHGLLFTTPWALLGLTRIPEAWSEKNPRYQAISLTTLLGMIGYAVVMLVFRASSPHGGLEWGARFALLFFPLLAILACSGKTANRVYTAILVIFIAAGIGFQIRGLATIEHDKRINLTLNKALTDAPQVQVLSDLWWMPLNAAPIYPQKAFFLAENATGFAEWLEQAGSQGFVEVYLVTLDQDLPQKISSNLSSYTLTVPLQMSIENLYTFHLKMIPK